MLHYHHVIIMKDMVSYSVTWQQIGPSTSFRVRVCEISPPPPLWVGTLLTGQDGTVGWWIQPGYSKTTSKASHGTKSSYIQHMCTYWESSDTPLSSSWMSSPYTLFFLSIFSASYAACSYIWNKIKHYETLNSWTADGGIIRKLQNQTVDRNSEKLLLFSLQ